MAVPADRGAFVEQKRRIIPPVYLLATLAAMVALDRWVPIANIVDMPWRRVGWVLVAAGVLLSASSAIRFRRAGTPVIPFERSTVLVTGGAFRYTRNPMYLGMVMLLIGVAFALGSMAAFLPIPIFIVIIQAWFIAGEERFLEEIFGEAYLAYKRQVRRWL